jgi:hypothetical protein
MNFGSGFLTTDAAVEHPLNASAPAAVEMNSRLLIAMLPLFGYCCCIIVIVLLNKKSPQLYQKSSSNSKVNSPQSTQWGT